MHIRRVWSRLRTVPPSAHAQRSSSKENTRTLEKAAAAHARHVFTRQPPYFRAFFTSSSLRFLSSSRKILHFSGKIVSYLFCFSPPNKCPFMRFPAPFTPEFPLPVPYTILPTIGEPFVRKLSRGLGSKMRNRRLWLENGGFRVYSK